MKPVLDDAFPRWKPPPLLRAKSTLTSLYVALPFWIVLNGCTTAPKDYSAYSDSQLYAEHNAMDRKIESLERQYNFLLSQAAQASTPEMSMSASSSAAVAGIQLQKARANRDAAFAEATKRNRVRMSSARAPTKVSAPVMDTEPDGTRIPYKSYPVAKNEERTEDSPTATAAPSREQLARVGNRTLRVYIIAPSVSTSMEARAIRMKYGWVESRLRQADGVLVVVRSMLFYPLNSWYDSVNELEDDADNQLNISGENFHVYTYSIDDDMRVSQKYHVSYKAED